MRDAKWSYLTESYYSQKDWECLNWIVTPKFRFLCSLYYLITLWCQVKIKVCGWGQVYSLVTWPYLRQHNSVVALRVRICLISPKPLLNLNKQLDWWRQEVNIQLATQWIIGKKIPTLYTQSIRTALSQRQTWLFSYHFQIDFTTFVTVCRKTLSTYIHYNSLLKRWLSVLLSTVVIIFHVNISFHDGNSCQNF